MKKLGVIVLVFVGALAMLAVNYAFAQSEAPVGKCPHARFDAMDTDKDGKISHDEFMAKCEKRFKAMDANNDGFVSKEEKTEACKKKWEAKKGQKGPCPYSSKAAPAESKTGTSE